MKHLSATLKGLITGALMIVVSLFIYQAKGSFDNPLQYITYAVYVGGIIWTLLYFHQHSSQEKVFKNYFSQGFKCFIVVTLVMVAFTWAFMQLNPGMEDDMAVAFRKDLVAQGNQTPSEIESNVAKAREYFMPMLISGVIFGYLLIGSVITAITSLFLARKQMNVPSAR